MGRARHAGWYVVIAALVVALFGVAGYGPLSFMKRNSAKAANPAAKPVASKKPKPAKADGPTTTSTTIVALELRSYKVGDCVTFDQRPADFQRETKVVQCDQPHLMEMTTSLNLEGRFDHFPNAIEWQALYDHDCTPSMRKLLGGPIDPVGRYYATGIQPLHDAWAEGDRTMWCGVGKAPLTRPPNDTYLTPFTGKVEGTSQYRIVPVGSCVDRSGYVVPCTQSHDAEVAGSTDITGKVALPPAVDDNPAWDRLVGDACLVVARGYLGRDLVNGEGAGWMPIEAGSWAAGRRTVQCTVAHYHGDQVAPTTGSLKG